MKIKTYKIGQCEVRWTRQSYASKFGPGCHIVRVIIRGKKRFEKSFGPSQEMSANEAFDIDCRFANRLASETN